VQGNWEGWLFILRRNGGSIIDPIGGYVGCDYQAAPRRKVLQPSENVVAEKENAMRRMFGFMIGILVGGLVGSTVALLLAPESGEKFRGELRFRGESFLAEVRSAAETRRAELTDRLETLRSDRTPRMPGS
jgi:hypothetical protein